MRIAVLTTKEIYIRDTKSDDDEIVFYERIETNYHHLFSAVDHFELDYLWVLCDVVGTDVDPHFDGYTLYTSKSKPFGKRPPQLQGWRMFLKGAKGNDSRNIYVILCQKSKQWKFQKMKDGQELLHTLVLLAQQGIVFKLSPGDTGRSLINSKVDKAWLTPCDLSGVPETFAILPDFKRELTGDEHHKKYFHVYDKSAQYLKACTGVELGVGSPRLIDFYRDRTERIIFSERQPGLWLVSVDGELQLQWYWTPYIHYLRRTGHDVVFYSAWLWDRHHAILRQWAEYLWKVRVAVAHNEHAKSINKMFYTQAFGWLHLREDKHKAEHDDLFRPDWNELLRQHAFCLINYKIDQFRRLGYDASWCLVDEIGFVSDDPNPLTAVPGLASENAEIGGFSVKYGSIPLSAVRHAFDKDVSHADAMHIIGKAGKAVGKWH